MSAPSAEDGRDPPGRGEAPASGTPGAGDGDPAGLAEDEFFVDRSLLEDVEALIEDGRTYFEAELNFQKTRAAFAADRAKKIAVLGAGAVVVLFLALIGLTVGLIIAFTPLLTAWGATALVVGAMLVVALLMLRGAAAKWGELLGAFDDADPGDEA